MNSIIPGCPRQDAETADSDIILQKIAGPEVFTSGSVVVRYLGIIWKKLYGGCEIVSRLVHHYNSIHIC